MTTSRTPRVRLLSAGATCALAVGALVALPTTTATAAPDEGVEATAAERPGNLALVRNERQLRRAVLQANRRKGRNKIKLLAPITFSPNRPTNGGARRGDLDIRSTIIVIGRDGGINANNVDRAFDVRGTGTLILRELKIRNGASKPGESGGAVRNAGVTMLRGSVINRSTASGEGASGGAIMNNGGRIGLYDSRLAGNTAPRAGGAIEALGGSTRVIRSGLVRNRTGAEPGNGGGLHLTGAGRVIFRESRVFGNSASAEGGGLWNSGEGRFTVDRSLVARNTASGPDADQGGGGLYNDGGTMRVTDSRVRGNDAVGAAGSGGGVLNNGGALSVVNNSKIWGNDAQRAGGGIEAVGGSTVIEGSMLNSNRTGTAPGNGGALHLTGEGTVDVRGSDVVNNSAVEGGGLWNSGVGTMTITNSTLTGNSASGAAADQGGGALYNEGGELTVTGSTIGDNTATGESGSGGGILNNLGSLEVVESTLSGNTAPRAGGAIEANVGDTTVTDSTMSGNSAGPNPGNGGALHLTGAGTVDVSGSEVTGNTAAAEGGGLWNSATGTFTVADTLLTGNTAGGAAADQGGGALFNDGGSLTVTGSTINDNEATGEAGSGGGILNNLGSLEVSTTTLSGNSAPRAGGAVETNVGTVTLTDVDMTGNDTGANPGNGGGLHLTGAATVDYNGGTVTGNSAAAEGGGLWNSSTGTLTADVEISGNTAPVGPNAYNDGGTFVLNGEPVEPGPPGV